MTPIYQFFSHKITTVVTNIKLIECSRNLLIDHYNNISVQIGSIHKIYIHLCSPSMCHSHNSQCSLLNRHVSNAQTRTALSFYNTKTRHNTHRYNKCTYVCTRQEDTHTHSKNLYYIRRSLYVRRTAFTRRMHCLHTNPRRVCAHRSGGTHTQPVAVKLAYCLLYFLNTNRDTRLCALLCCSSFVRIATNAVGNCQTLRTLEIVIVAHFQLR